MPRISNIEILQKMEQPTVFIRTIGKVQELPVLIGQSYGKMAASLQELGELLADEPSVAYHNMDMQNLDVEFGFPVARPLPGKSNIQSGSIPARKVVIYMYRVAYSEMAPVYDEMVKFSADHRLKPVGTAYEHYYNGPEFPVSDMLTMLVMPVK